MSQDEFTAGARWIIGGALFVAMMVYCPALISAPTSQAVMNGVFLGGVCLLGAALSIAGRFDALYDTVYRTFRDAINDK